VRCRVSCGLQGRNRGESARVSKERQDMVNVALLVRLEAKPGKEADVERFLREGLVIVREEPATATWYAIKLGPSTFGIFDTFADEAGRQEHLAGRVAAALMARASALLAQPPVIEKVDVLAAKLPRLGGERENGPQFLVRTVSLCEFP